MNGNIASLKFDCTLEIKKTVGKLQRNLGGSRGFVVRSRITIHIFLDFFILFFFVLSIDIANEQMRLPLKALSRAEFVSTYPFIASYMSRNISAAS